MRLRIDPRRVLGRRDSRIYGHFIEHFHRQIYGGIYDPGSPLSDARGLRTDVIAALRDIGLPVLRWPGGCFVSAYHWKDGIGPDRQAVFDKAWRVEEPNLFGTDEFIRFCREVRAEPYICTNAGTGTGEEMSDWVEYCNLPTGGRWARARAANGSPEPYGVKYWSIGNENYLTGEMGSKTLEEWGPYVREAAKMMRRVDPTIEIFAACVGRDRVHRTSTAEFDWNVRLLQEAGEHIDWVSIHGYWDRINRVTVTEEVSPYEACAVLSTQIEERILLMKHLLGAMGFLGKIRIAFDEWNLRSWNHPNMGSHDERDYLSPRDANDRNRLYTMADAIFAASFLNQCLRHCDVVGMANFSPVVNTRGVVFTHPEGIVLRPTYFVFQLYTRYLGDRIVDSWLDAMPRLEVNHGGAVVSIEAVDAVATLAPSSAAIAVAFVNRDPKRAVALEVEVVGAAPPAGARLRTLAGDDKDAYNDVECPDNVGVKTGESTLGPDGSVTVTLPPHSVSVLTLS